MGDAGFAGNLTEYGGCTISSPVRAAFPVSWHDQPLVSPAQVICGENAKDPMLRANALFSGLDEISMVCNFENGERQISGEVSRHWAEHVGSRFRTLTLCGVAAVIGDAARPEPAATAVDLEGLECVICEAFQAHREYVPNLVFGFGVISGRPYLNGIRQSATLNEWHRKNAPWFDGLVTFEITFETPAH